MCVRRKLRVINQNAKGLQKSKFRSSFSQELFLSPLSPGCLCLLLLDRRNIPWKALRACEMLSRSKFKLTVSLSFLLDWNALTHFYTTQHTEKHHKNKGELVDHNVTQTCNTAATLFNCGKKEGHKGRPQRKAPIVEQQQKTHYTMS